MRQGDRFLLVLIGLSIAISLADLLSAGSVVTWLQGHLPGLAQITGSVLVNIGRLAWWLILIPLGLAIAGRFIALPTAVHEINARFIRAIEAVTGMFGGAARWFALGLVIATAVIVIQRYVFGYASTKLQESVIYMHALLFLLASASTLMADGHVRVDVFFTQASARGKAWIDLAGTYLALIPMSVLILWSSTGYMASTWRILERSRESDGLPFVFLLKTAIPLFAILMILQGLSMASRAALTLAGQSEPEKPRSLAEGEV
ncbi:MAG: TRAP transporter small permease subunit [Alphaproteobacteria bacterium]|nr:TRAP transporter small permease subunit [Alphaproteobacteria bacterium]